MKIISCNSNIKLAKDVANYLGIDLTKMNIKQFPDKELFVEIEESIRGDDVFVIQSTSCPANDHLMEMLITIDALHRSSASRIIAVMPYFGYSRQDRKTAPRTPITAKLVANLITGAGTNRVLTLDLHSNQIHGFFDIGVDILSAAPVFVRDILVKQYDNPIITSPDAGGVARARVLAKKLDLELSIIDKRRNAQGLVAEMRVIGDVNNKTCILLDDIVDSASTICKAATSLKEMGAKAVYAYATHGVLSSNAINRINNSDLTEMIITDSIAHNISDDDSIRVISAVPLIGDAISRIANNMSVSSLINN